MNAYFYPHKLVPTAKIAYVLDYLGIKVTDSKAELKFHWDYKDVNLGNKGWINGECKNIEKWYVDKIFTGIFGYSSLVDPSKPGICIRKDNKQYSHSGVLIATPCKVEPGYIYQRYMNNIVGDWREIIRILIAKKDILILIKQQKGLITDGADYSGIYPDWELKSITLEEKKKVIEFSQKIGMDWGELDAIRDGKLYIIDVNNIPGGQALAKLKERKRFLKELSEMFERNFL